jgi:hypothetical protein
MALAERIACPDLLSRANVPALIKQSLRLPGELYRSVI